MITSPDAQRVGLIGAALCAGGALAFASSAADLGLVWAGLAVLALVLCFAAGAAYLTRCDLDRARAAAAPAQPAAAPQGRSPVTASPDMASRAGSLGPRRRRQPGSHFGDLGWACPAVGESIVSYEIESILAQGASGALLRAWDADRGRRVALKVTTRPSEIDDRWDMRAHHAVRHPHLLQMIDCRVLDDALVMAAPFMDGVDLGTLLNAEGRLPVDRVVAILGQVASAVDALHAQGIVHGDVRPENILVSQGNAYLVDFSWDPLPPAQQPHHESHPASIVDDQIELAEDISSLGSLMYTCLAGVRDARHGERPSSMTQASEWPPITDVSPSLMRLIQEAVGSARADRVYRTCTDFVSSAARAAAAG